MRQLKSSITSPFGNCVTYGGYRKLRKSSENIDRIAVKGVPIRVVCERYFDLLSSATDHYPPQL